MDITSQATKDRIRAYFAGSSTPKPPVRSLHRTDRESDGKSDELEGTAGASVINFARYVDGALVLFPSEPERLEYIALSHVWGTWEWRDISGIPYKVKASQEKADFIANDLPALVGDSAFWMDTLTVDQSKDEEIMKVVRLIPVIFRAAQKTIAVRESDGLYDCCVKAAKGFKDYPDLVKKLNEHGGHAEHLYKESYLQRLWTL